MDSNVCKQSCDHPSKDVVPCIITGTKEGQLSWWSQPASNPQASCMWHITMCWELTDPDCNEQRRTTPPANGTRVLRDDDLFSLLSALP